jgi:zinc transport system ATP-binding protein
VGPNGAGKTMLFRALLNLAPYTGKIEWEDKVKIGYVPQKLYVGDIPISVKEFLTFKCDMNEQIRSCVNSVELEVESILDRRLNVLSGGQLQRVLIAWALLDNPNVLLFDEPTSAVDIDSEETIYEMLNKLERKHRITMLMITHDIHVVRDFSEYMLALNKRLVFFGKSEEITNPSLLQTIYGSGTVLKSRKERGLSE